MSLQYDAYLKEHISNVCNGYLWILGHVKPEILDKLLPGIRWEQLMSQIKIHDWSKRSEEEYEAYDAYFYGFYNENKEKVKKDFDRAWLHHIHNNPHHWQYWILIEDDDNGGDRMKPLNIPNEYVFEMICDWWSFSWRKGDLREIFNWWDEHRSQVIMTDESREKVEGLLELIKEGIEKDEEEMGKSTVRDIMDISGHGFDEVIPIGGVVKVDEVEV